MPEWAIATLTPDEKRDYINENFNIDLLPASVDPLRGEPAEAPITNEAMRDLTGRQLQNIQRIVRKFNKGEITRDQAAQMLKDGFTMSEENVNVWLGEIEEL